MLATPLNSTLFRAWERSRDEPPVVLIPPFPAAAPSGAGLRRTDDTPIGEAVRLVA